jgi:hypothetical protein
MRTFFAIIACLVLIILWNVFCTTLGWKHQGGAIPASIFCVFVLFVWQAIRGTGIFKKKSAIQPDDGSSSSGLSLIILPLAVFVIYGLSQMYAGFVGIESYADNGWAYAALAAALFARFTLPLTVGCYYAAEHVWGWHWSLALLFAAPGLAFNLLMLPGLAANAFSRFSGKSNSDAPESETTTPDEYRPTSVPLTSPPLSEPMSNHTKYVPPSVSLIPAAAPIELSGYELLAAEKEKGYRHEALWLKCHSEVDGDQTKAESAYNRARAAMLAKESVAKVAMESGLPTAPFKSKPPSGTRPIKVALVVLSFVAALLCAVIPIWWVDFKERKQVTPMLAQPAAPEPMVSIPAILPATLPVMVTPVEPKKTFWSPDMLHAEIKFYNPSYAGTGEFVMKDGQPFAMSLRGAKITDLEFLTKLSPFALDLSGTPIQDIRQVKGLNLVELYLEDSPVTDLSPLRGMPLKKLYLSRTPVSDLSALSGAPLIELNVVETKVSDLTPLSNSPIQMLWLTGTPVVSISALKGVPLVSLTLHRTQVTDLSPLSGSSLQRLHIGETPVSDLTPLKGMSLTRLVFTPANIKAGLDVARFLPVQEIGTKFEEASKDLMPPAAFWAQFGK